MSQTTARDLLETLAMLSVATGSLLEKDGGGYAVSDTLEYVGALSNVIDGLASAQDAAGVKAGLLSIAAMCVLTVAGDSALLNSKS